jgi:hypothetical protein
MHKRKNDCIFDPIRAIACAVLDQAVIDLRHYQTNPVRAFDASVFLVCEGAEFAEVAGLKVTDEHWEVIIGRLF